MDAAGLTVLITELRADCAVAQNAAAKASQRLEETSPGRLEACAYELNRFYNVFERMLERICEEFENHFERHGDYHERLLHRLALDLPGIRPAFIPSAELESIRELKGFRHLMRHAYDLTLREDRLAELARSGTRLAEALPTWSREFERKVRAEQGWK